MRKGCSGPSKIAIFPQFLTIDPRFVRTGCSRTSKIAILPQFSPIDPHFVRKGCSGASKLAIFPQFLTIDPHFVRKGCSGTSKIAILPQFSPINPHFVPINPHFVRKSSHFVTPRRHHPRPKERKIKKARERKGREKGERERREERGEREKEREGVSMWRWADVKMRRCEDKKMWRWADVKMSRCEDEKMWRWEDVKMRRCEDEKMPRWEDVKMRRCEDEKMWRWEDVKMRMCEDEKMWRWEGVKLRRWDTDPHYWKNPALRRSREKIWFDWLQTWKSGQIENQRHGETIKSMSSQPHPKDLATARECCVAWTWAMASMAGWSRSTSPSAAAIVILEIEDGTFQEQLEQPTKMAENVVKFPFIPSSSVYFFGWLYFQIDKKPEKNPKASNFWLRITQVLWMCIPGIVLAYYLATVTWGHHVYMRFFLKYMYVHLSLFLRI